MNLIRTSILALIATVTRMLSALVINKAVSIFIGPSGLALIGQFQNFSQLVMTFAKGGINTGVTKYLAEYKGDRDKSIRLLATSFRISFLSSIFTGSFIIAFSSKLSLYFLKTIEFRYIFILFGFTIILFVLNNLILSALNGLKEIKKWISINITQSIYSLIFTSLLIGFFGIDGALIALVTNQSVILIIVLYNLRKHAIINFSNFLDKANFGDAKKLAKYSSMAFATAITVPLSQLLIRNHIGENLGWNEAGYWQAIWYISSMYLGLITTSLSIYYVPKISETNNNPDIRKEIVQGAYVIIPIVMLAALCIYTLRNWIILILFSKDFIAMEDLFLWQLIGDVIKVFALLLAYIMHAKAMTLEYIFSEIIASISFVILSIFFVNTYGLIGMSYSYALNYSLYFILVLFLTKKHWL